MHKISLTRLAIAIGCISLAACSAPVPKAVDTESAGASPAATAEASSEASAEASASTAAASGPYKVMSCTEEITFEKEPERVVLLNDIGVPFMAGLKKLDKVVAMSKKPSAEIYEDSVYKELEAVPLLEGTANAGGGVIVAVEKILEVHPDLVVGTTSAADTDALKKAGINFYVPDQYCKDIPRKPASFEDMTKESMKFAKIFNDEAAGEALVEDLNKKIEEVRKNAPKDRGTGMGIYIDEGTEEFWGYGNASMVQPLFEAVGLENVYKDNPERLIEGMSMEAVLDKNPGTIVLLYINGTPDGVIKTFESIPGANELDAVKNKKVYAMPFRLTDPPSPVTVTGVEKLNSLLDS